MLGITVRSLFTVHVLYHGPTRLFIPLRSKTDYTLRPPLLKNMYHSSVFIINEPRQRGFGGFHSDHIQIRLSNKYTDQLLGYYKPDLHLSFRVCKDLYYTRNTCTRTQMFGDVPVIVTFFISSSVCRHCKTTYDVFGVFLLNLRKYGYQTRFLTNKICILSTARSLGFCLGFHRFSGT